MRKNMTLYKVKRRRHRGGVFEIYRLVTEYEMEWRSQDLRKWRWHGYVPPDGCFWNYKRVPIPDYVLKRSWAFTSPIGSYKDHRGQTCIDMDP